MREKRLLSEAFGGCSDPGDPRDFPVSSGMKWRWMDEVQDKGSHCLVTHSSREGEVVLRGQSSGSFMTSSLHRLLCPKLQGMGMGWESR